MIRFTLGFLIGVLGTAFIGSQIVQGVAGEVFTLACKSDIPTQPKSPQLATACGAAQAKESLDKASGQFSQFVDKIKGTR